MMNVTFELDFPLHQKSIHGPVELLQIQWQNATITLEELDNYSQNYCFNRKTDY